MNTTVITADAHDFGAGPQHRHTFVDCRWHVDNAGTLHIVRARGNGNSAAFAAGAWVSATDGSKVVAAEVGR